MTAIAATPRNYRALDMLLFLAAASWLFVTVGGRTFQAVEITDHFTNDHPECRDIKERALGPQAKWSWLETLRGPCAVYRDPVTLLALVIVLRQVGRGCRATLVLITGYVPDEGVEGWKHRPGNQVR